MVLLRSEAGVVPFLRINRYREQRGDCRRRVGPPSGLGRFSAALLGREAHTRPLTTWVYKIDDFRVAHCAAQMKSPSFSRSSSSTTK
jgi:hypothetical protein